MDTATYFLFLFGVFIVGMLIMTAYYLFSERREFMEVSDGPLQCRLNRASTIQSLILIAATVLFCFLCPDGEQIKNDKMYFVSALFGFFALIGIIPLKNKLLSCFVLFLQAAGIAAALWILPEKTSFFPYEMPLWADRAGAGVLWFSAFRLLMRLDDLDSFTAQQGTAVGLTCAVGLFLTHSLSDTFFQFSGILFAVSAVLNVFFVLGASIPSTRIFKNTFAFSLTWISFYMAAQGRWGSGALLLAYPLAEGVIYLCRGVKAVLLKTKPLFLYETLTERNFPDRYITRFIFRRNLLIGGLFLLSLMAELQYQPVILASLFMLDYYIRIVSPKRDDSLRSLFKGMARDAQKGFQETNKAFSDLKEIYKNKTEDKRDEDR